MVVMTPDAFRALLSVVTPDILSALLRVVIPLTITALLKVLGPLKVVSALLRMVVPFTWNVADGVVVFTPRFDVNTLVFVRLLILLLVQTEVLLPRTPALEAKLAVV